MELRRGRSAGRGRAPFGGTRLALVAAALYLAAGVAATAPALPDAWSSYLAWGERPAGRVSPGDHLQAGYQLWLLGHQLEGGAAPWRDPYSFRPEASAPPNFAAWPLGLPYWPLERALGHVRAWNALVLLAFVAAGGLACAWLRSLGLGIPAALAGGLVFALAPYRVAQSTEHVLGLVAVFLPLALLGVERARRGSEGWLVLGVAAAVSMPLSGQVHLALGAVPFVAAYALWRGLRGAALAVAGLGAAAALLVYATAIRGSTEAGGRSLSEVARYSAEPLELLTRTTENGLERVVFLGWLTPLLALAGAVVLVRADRRGLAALLGVGALVPILLTLGTNLPTYELLWDALPPFRFPRVPGRLLPVAALALAALAAFALDELRRPALALLALPVLAVDLWIGAFEASAADPDNRAYATLRAQPSGRVLELPVFVPERYLGSAYLEYAVQAPRERPGGYSTLAPREAEHELLRLRALNCGRGRLPARLGIRFVVIHRALFDADGIGRRCLRSARARLWAAGFRPVARHGPVELLRR